MTTARNLTAAVVQYRKNRINSRLIFGSPIVTIRRDWRRKLEVFEPGQIFGYVRWRGDKFGTQGWQFYILRCCSKGSISAIDGVIPGAEILLCTRGSVRTSRALKWLRTVERQINALETISPSYWRHAHNAIEIGHEPRIVSTVQIKSFTRSAS